MAQNYQIFGLFSVEKRKSQYKKQADFDKNLSQYLSEIGNREDIKAVIDKYEPHIKLVYDIYSKIGCNTISFYSKEVIHLSEFRQFLINFIVLGLLISTEQMNWVFQKITTKSMDSKDDQLYMDYGEFKLSLLYLTVLSKFAFKERKLIESDLQNVDAETVENFFQYLRFSLPFNKNQLENLINQRRAMSFKELLNLQKEIKKQIKNFNQSDSESKAAEREKRYKKIIRDRKLRINE